MAKKVRKIPRGYYKITPAQLNAICNAADTLSGMDGGGGDDFNEEVQDIRKKIDAFLKANGLKRTYT